MNNIDVYLKRLDRGSARVCPVLCEDAPLQHDSVHAQVKALPSIPITAV